MAAIGSIIDHKYEILTEIGRGGMSVVYLAMDRRLNKQWAIKEIKTTVNNRDNEIIIQSLITEANLMKRLDHPTLPRIVDIIDEGHTIYVVMDYIEGKSLDKIIDENGAQPQDMVIEWAKELCDALGYLHSRKPAIIYRDMKPANIMLKPDGGLKLIDFGIAREYKEQNIADTVSLGTKGYAAPEQFGGRGQTDARTDIYCLGVTLYHMITGKSPAEPPYEIYPIRYWNPSFSSGLEKIIQKCTMLNPEDRYQSCEELMYALEHYEEIDEGYRRKQRRRFSTFVTCATLTVAFFISGFSFNHLSVKENSANYEATVEAASKTNTYEDRIQGYIDAIEYDAGRIESYEGLISTFKTDDGKFTVKEEEILIGLVNKNKNAILAKPERYVQLSYDIGKLYWFYYDYGNTSDNTLTRTVASITWFSDVINYADSKNIEFPNYNISKIYQEIGIFNRDYTIYAQEAQTNEKAGEYWQMLNNLLNFMEENPDEEEYTIWQGYRVLVSSLSNYMTKFKASGVTEEEMKMFIEAIEKDVNEMPATDEVTMSIQEELAASLDKQSSGGIYDKFNRYYAE